MKTPRKLLRSVAAVALVLPLGIAVVAAPAGATTAQLVDSPSRAWVPVTR